MQNLIRSTVALLAVAAAATVAQADDTGVVVPENPGSIVLVDQLDETPDGDFYCADVFGSTVALGDGMQAHTCKEHTTPAEDQQFTTNYPMTGNIYVTQADLCVQWKKLTPGSQFQVVECNTSRRQQWVSWDDGSIRPVADTTLCWTVEPGPHGRPGSPDGMNYKRSLTMETCDPAVINPRFTTWYIPGGSVGTP